MFNNSIAYRSGIRAEDSSGIVVFLLASASREISRQLEARLRQEGVPVEQWRILKVLSDGKGHSLAARLCRA